MSKTSTTHMATTIENIPAKRFQTTLGVSKGNCEMFYSIDVDGKRLGRWQSDSFTFPMAQYLYKRIGATFSISSILRWGEPTDAVQDGDDVRVSASFNLTIRDSYFDERYGYYVKLPGLSHLDGFYSGPELEYAWSSAFRIKNASLDGKELGGGGYVTVVQLTDNTRSLFGTNWRIVPGSGTAPVSVMDWRPDKLIEPGTAAGQLEYGGQDYGTFQSTQEESKSSLSRTFINNSGDTVEINELGIIPMRGGSSNFSADNAPMFLRDRLESSVQVPDGATITVNYEIIHKIDNFNQDTDLSGTNSGFTQTFASRLNGYLIRTSTTTSDWITYPFRGIWGAGVPQPGTYSDARFQLGLESRQSENFGVLVGSNNHYVSVTDESLFGKIVHGQGDGQLLHTGSYLSELTIDRTNNEAWFDIGRLFVNQGSTAITIKEVGLALNNSTNNYMWTAELMARTALHPDDQMTLNPGEVALIEYRIKYIV